MAAMSLSAALTEIKKSAFPFYVYILRRPNGDPFYVGKGKRDRRRIAVHAELARKKIKRPVLDAIRSIWKSGNEVAYDLVAFFADENEALNEEIRLIKVLCRRCNGGPLLNDTAGGDGVSGFKHTEEARAKMRASQANPEARKRAAENMRRLHSDPNFVVALQGSQKRRLESIAAFQRSESSRACRSEHMKAHLRANPNAKAARADHLRKINRILVQDGTHAALTRASWADPEVRERRIAGLRMAALNPELLAKRSEQMKRRWSEARRRQNDEKP